MTDMLKRLMILPMLLTVVGCGSASDEAPGEAPLPVALGEWVEIETGGDTICSRGTDYSFFVRGGVSERLIIDFRGGGACWDELTCLAGKAFDLFSAEVDDFEGWRDAVGERGFGGIYDDTSPEYPFADWTLVHVPYCTGDIHWGDNVADYGDFELNHKGFVNAQAVLSWVYEKYPSPEHVLVTGCSAGAYGAILHSAYIAEQYPEATLRTLSDSGAGIITQTFFEDSFPNWKALDNLPPDVERLDKPITELTAEDLYAGVSTKYPQHRFAHYSTNYDADQTFYFSAMGGQAREWPGLMRQRMQAIHADADNFAYYIAPGPVHCITPYDFMFERKGQTPFITWLEDFVYGDAAPEPYACEGAACDEAPLCDRCASADEPDLYCSFCEGWPEDYVVD